MNSEAVYAGSFDPLTFGHLDIVSRAARLFSHVTIAVLRNPDKRCRLTVEERIDIIRAMTAGLPNVHVATFDGLLVDYLRQTGIHFCIRGVRNGTDLDVEMQTAHINHRLGQDMEYTVETVALFTAPQLSFISSTMVRQIASFGGDVTHYTDQRAQDALYRAFGITQKGGNPQV